MRQTIKTVPMDGELVILEDDASGTYEIARWSTESGGWVGEIGWQSKITPTYWHPLSQQDNGSGVSRAGRSASGKRRFGFFPFSSHRATPDRCQVPNDANLSGSAAVAARVNLAEVDAQTALVKAKRRPRARLRLAVSSIAATLVGAAFLGFLFRVELAAYATRYAHSDIANVDIAKIGAFSRNAIERIVKHETTSPKQESPSAGSSAHEQEPLHPLVGYPLGGVQEHAQVTQTAEGALEPRKSSDKERGRPEDLANALAEARRLTNVQNGQPEAAAAQLRLSNRSTAEQLRKALEREREKTASLDRDVIELQQELKANSGRHRHELAEERERAAALSRELATARDEMKAHAALLSEASSEVAQVRQAAETATAELEHFLQQERDKTEALTRELALVRGRFEAHVSLATKTVDEATKRKQAADTAADELRQSLRQEREKTEALSRELAKARDGIEADAARSSKVSSEAAQVRQAAETETQEKGNQGAALERPATTARQGGPEAARLLARGSELLGQGNVGAARIVLERAAEIGSIQATFALAETYDPLILLTWRTYGTRGDATKARDLYAKAYAAGIQEAKDRLNALRP